MSNLTGYCCGICKAAVEKDGDLPFCDHCQQFFHYECAQLEKGVKDDSWRCPNCAAEMEVTQVIVKFDDLEKTLLELEAEAKRQEERIVAEQQLHKRRLELQQQTQQRQQEAERQMLALEQQLMEQQLAAEKQFQEQQKKNKEDFEAKMAQLKAEAKSPEEKKKRKTKTSKGDKKKLDASGTAGPSGISTPLRHPGVTIPEVPKPKPTPIPADSGEEGNGNEGDESGSDTSGTETESSSSDDEQEKAEVEPPKQLRGPTKAQLTARQFLARKLPVFTGRCEEWPMFISSYETSNLACGFSNVENLARLQDSIREPALTNVRSLLLLPEKVPAAIETLRMLYGRPEQLLNTLLIKVRKADSPRSDRLESFIYFGVVVQQLVDHLEATHMNDHLVNPLLIRELVEKLPAGSKLEWIRFKKLKKHVSLRTFADFLSDIVTDASEATLFTEPQLQHQPQSRRDAKPKAGSRTHESYLHTHAAAENSGDTNHAGVNNKRPCRICDRTDHRVRNCEKFKQLKLEDRLDAVKKWQLCKLCLNEHGSARCRMNFRCNVRNCKERHNALLHIDVPATVANCNAHDVRARQPVIFRMIPVTLYNGGRSVNIIAFLDEGASYTLVDESITKLLNVRGSVQPLRIMWTAGVSRLEKHSENVCLSISARGVSTQFQIKNAHTVNELKLPEQTVCFADVVKEYKHLHDLPVADYRGAPKILIGLKDLHLYAPLESRIGGAGEPIAVKSKLGWTIYGPHENNAPAAGFVGHHACHQVSNQDLHDLLKNQYLLEETGISMALLPESDEDKRARSILESTTVRIGDRYETGLLWKADDTSFPDSYVMALKRLKSLERKLLKNDSLYDNVRRQIVEYQQKGYAHKASQQELAACDPRKVWYLPLNVVTHPKKPEKVRLVWDAAATVAGVSLNSQLLKGPDMLTLLPSVIFRFRERPVGFGGDIREMYHQLRIRKEDTNAQRFLFRNDPTAEPEVYIMDVATFGATCSPCAAQFVKNKNAEEFSKQYPVAAKAIVENHYVDDYYDSALTVDEAIQRAKEVRLIHSKAGFEIRNWVASSSEVVRALGEEEADQKVHLSQNKTTGYERVLGIVWNTSTDEFLFSAEMREDLERYLKGELRPTKRVVSSCVMSLFDPQGFLISFTIFGRILIQDLWRAGCDWDKAVDDEAWEKWKRWVSRLQEVEGVRIPRYYFQGAHDLNYETLELHVFCDASQCAYGAVAFFWIMSSMGPICALVSGKSKVAPLKLLSIPRLELQSDVVGSRLMNFVQENHTLKIAARFIWSDSEVALSWIHSDQRKYKQFVAFRVGEILTLTKQSEWRKVPSKLNLADMLTKWDNKHSFGPDGPWSRAPEFIEEAKRLWAISKQQVKLNTPEEMRASVLYHSIIVTEQIIDPKNFSRWTVMVRSVACLARFRSNCHRKAQGLPIEALPLSKAMKGLVKRTVPVVPVPLKREEYQMAETYLWRWAQADYFPDEVTTLLKNLELPADKKLSLEKSSVLYKLTPFLDEQKVMRVDGRLERATMVPFEVRFPVILPKGHPVTTKLLEHYHQKMGHAYFETAINELRQRFFIPNLRAELKRVMTACVKCKVEKSVPAIPRMAPLPVQRVTPHQRAFSYTGVDYFGPIAVTVGRRSEKRWVSLFTCLTTRAIHLEVVHSLTTQSCVMAIRRFACRRGMPIEFFSDNGTNFQGASKEIVRVDAECREEFTDARTSWNFNPPSAPHMGGAWERLVRSVKEALKAFDDGSKLTDEVLLTSLAEAEDLINTRPLTYLSTEAGSTEALTPNHFLRGVTANDGAQRAESTSPAEALRDCYKRSQLLADCFWKRWIAEYLPTLNQRTKWHAEAEPIACEDVVYVVEGANRGNWVRGIVTEVFKGADGRIRQALVRTSRGELKRPVSKLAVLEIQERKTGAKEAPPTRVTGRGNVRTAGQLMKNTMPASVSREMRENAEKNSDGRKAGPRRKPM
ncbi:uncharacterized protein LOC120426603 [Culex pipiens pallens]|uniref:uncharacterized protein LOC120426603 n=1 Tax=Culex pipiens pallens TaxID=42434 RepID=UPI00195428B0|nr:uncharacterized protein LOC120426603 [Culex pipiens pallens]